MENQIIAKPLQESEHGYKIDLSEASKDERKEAQELAFELGWKWQDLGKQLMPLLFKGLGFVEPDKKLVCVTGIAQTFYEWSYLEITLSDLRAAVKFKNRPVNVGILYSNDAEREAAIRQAESWGYPEWEHNQGYRNDDDNCIFLHKDDYWNDCEFESYDRLLLDRSFMKPDVKENFTTEKEQDHYTYPKSDYTPEPQENGDIILRKVDKEFEAAKEFLKKDEWYSGAWWNRNVTDGIARLMVEFKNAE